MYQFSQYINQLCYATFINEINSFVELCDANFLKVNTKKTEKVIFDPKGIGNHMPVSIYNQEKTQVQSYKYLGVHIDKSLTWDVHVKWVCKRLYQSLY